jgi:predicted small secreted protein
MRSRSVCSEVVLAALVALAACRTQTGPGATLHVTTAPEDRDADVYIDGNYIGRVGDLEREGMPKPKLAPGSHRVEVRKAGRFPVQRTVRVAAGGPATVTLTAELLEDPQ